MATNSIILFFANTFLFVLVLTSLVEATNNGFSIGLIHRDAHPSPYHNPSMSHMERLNKAFHRSFARASTFTTTSNSSSNTIQSQIHSSGGEYLMKLAIGSPPVDIFSIADTGSDVAWIQCNPCIECYKETAPLFDPQNSSSYKNLPCNAEFCEALPSSICNTDKSCEYVLGYGDRSSSEGNLAIETFTFGSSSGQPISIPEVVFGCGHENRGTFNGSGSGIIGLGGGSLSIIKQLDKYINGKFSYCLVPLGSPANVTGQLHFGSNAIVSGSKAVSTPLIQKNPATYYFLTLKGITVGDKKIEYTSSSYSEFSDVEEGNMIIDSGTTLTLLPSELYDSLESELVKSINGTRVPGPEEMLKLCYKKSDSIEFPKIVVHFTDADLELNSMSTFLEVAEDVICFTMAPSTNGLSIYGNLAQMNFLVGYDLVNKKVSFMPTDCANQQ